MVISNIPVLHSLSSDGGLNSTEISGVLKTSVASMTSTDMITLLASMTSIASLASKNQKKPALYILSDFPGIRNPSCLNDLNSLNNVSGLNGIFSIISVLRIEDTIENFCCI
jgi:hypothetical protein